MNHIYADLKKKAIEIAAELGTPRFYRIFEKEIQLSKEILYKNTMLRKCISHFDTEQEGLGHGYDHSRDVAIDAGAIVDIEARKLGLSEEVRKELITAAHIAGLLHDIKRGVEEHAIAGSREAETILECFGLSDRYKRYIVTAIRNHEAFKDVVEAEDAHGALISDALYDADKFRWGPDNFTKMVWDMLQYSNTPPEEFLENYKKGLQYIEKIKETFRSDTGKEYGPEIIDIGLQIGRKLYEELKAHLSA